MHKKIAPLSWGSLISARSSLRDVAQDDKLNNLGVLRILGGESFVGPLGGQADSTPSKKRTKRIMGSSRMGSPCSRMVFRP